MNPLIKWSPFLEPFEDMDRAFESLLPSIKRNRESFMPAIDMYEDKDSVVVETELAGIEPENVTVSIENDILTIKGSAEKKSEVEDKNYYRKEIRRGSFYRSIPLPTHVIGDKASASATDGVLRISIPKAPESKPKNIKIETKIKK